MHDLYFYSTNLIFFSKVGSGLELHALRLWYLLPSTIHVWRMGGSRGLLDKTLLYTQTVCPTDPEAAY